MKTAGHRVLPCDLENDEPERVSERRKYEEERAEERTESWEGLDFVLRPSRKLVERDFFSLGNETQAGRKS